MRAVVVQARMTSSRLPGKMMLPLAGRPVFRHVLDRAAEIPADCVVAALPDHPSSRPLVEEAWRANVAIYLGSHHDVLDRFYRAALSVRADIVMRITGDCPFLDPDICARVLDMVEGDVEYASNVLPRSFAKGLDCEAFTFAALRRAHETATDDYDREHVTPWLQRNCRTANYENRLVLDTPEDYRHLQKLVGDIE